MKIAGDGTATTNCENDNPEPHIQNFIEQHPQWAEFFKMFGVARHETPRGAVLIYATALDDLLRRCVEAFLVADPAVKDLTDGFNAPLGTFSSRIVAAYALGLVNAEEHRELHLVRKIRNDFAHSLDATFEDQAIAGRCRALFFAQADTEEFKLPAFLRFTTSALKLIMNLHLRSTMVGARRLTYGNWPLS